MKGTCLHRHLTPCPTTGKSPVRKCPKTRRIAPISALGMCDDMPGKIPPPRVSATIHPKAEELRNDPLKKKAPNQPASLCPDAGHGTPRWARSRFMTRPIPTSAITERERAVQIQDNRTFPVQTLTSHLKRFQLLLDHGNSWKRPHPYCVAQRFHVTLSRRNAETLYPAKKGGTERPPLSFAVQAHSLIYRPVFACGLNVVKGERTRPVNVETLIF